MRHEEHGWEFTAPSVVISGHWVLPREEARSSGSRTRFHTLTSASSFSLLGVPYVIRNSRTDTTFWIGRKLWRARDLVCPVQHSVSQYLKRCLVLVCGAIEGAAHIFIEFSTILDPALLHFMYLAKACIFKFPYPMQMLKEHFQIQVSWRQWPPYLIH